MCFYLPRRTLGDRILTASVFASFAMASNDFAIGFPVVDALYGATHPPPSPPLPVRIARHLVGASTGVGKAKGGVDTDALVAGNALIGRRVVLTRSVQDTSVTCSTVFPVGSAVFVPGSSALSCLCDAVG